MTLLYRALLSTWRTSHLAVFWFTHVLPAYLLETGVVFVITLTKTARCMHMHDSGSVHDCA